MQYTDVMAEPIAKTGYGNTTNRLVMAEQEMLLSGYADGLDAVGQTGFLTLNTERYQCPIYSWDYGVELNDLVGKPVSYVSSEIQRRVKDALCTDDRIVGCTDFVFAVSNKRKLLVRFTVLTIYGDIEAEVVV